MCVLRGNFPVLVAGATGNLGQHVIESLLTRGVFAVPGHGDFSPRNHRCWDPDPRRKGLEIWVYGVCVRV